MFIITLLLLQLSIGVLSQSVFDPAAFTQSACSGNNEWTLWFDSNDPTIAQGEFEVTSIVQQKFSAFMCSAPIAIEVIIKPFVSVFRTGK